MERYVILLLSLLFSVPSFAAQPSATPQVNPGAVAYDTRISSGSISIQPSDFTSSTGWFSIYAGDANAATTAAHFYPFYKNGVAYQVTAGKSAYCTNFWGAASPANDAYQLVYDTSSFAFNAASLTAGTYQGGAAAKYPMLLGPGTYSMTLNAGSFTFPQNVYAGIQVNGAAIYTVTALCIEK